MLKALCRLIAFLFLVAKTFGSMTAIAEPSSEKTEKITPSQLSFDQTESQENTFNKSNKHRGKTTPDGTVLELLSELKNTQNPLVVVDYVNWESAYQIYSQNQGGLDSEASSPDKLRNLYRLLFTGSPGLILKKIAPRLANISSAEQRKILDHLKSINEGALRSGEKLRDPNLATLLFEIRKTQIDGSRATVDLFITDKGKSRLEKLPLIKTGEVWLLERVCIVEDPLSR